MLSALCCRCWLLCILTFAYPPRPTAQTVLRRYVCAKNIRDGVIKAQLDRELGAMLSEDQADLYSTSDPQQSFHDRISFCLEMHDSAVKAMRYPPNAFRTNTGEDAVIEDVDVDELVEDDSDDE